MATTYLIQNFTTLFVKSLGLCVLELIYAISMKLIFSQLCCQDCTGCFARNCNPTYMPQGYCRRQLMTILKHRLRTVNMNKVASQWRQCPFEHSIKTVLFANLESIS